MTSQITGTAPIYRLNRNNGLETLTSFLSLKDRGSLRASSKTLKSDIPDIPEEAKAFLVFESKIPLIETIIRRTRAYRDNYLIMREINVITRTYMSTPFHIITVLVSPAISLFTGDRTDNIVLYSIPLMLSVAFLAGAPLIGRCQREINGAELRQLWQEYGNQPPHQDLFISGLTLRDQLRQHRIQMDRYTAAGGMDRYFRIQGLDSALAETPFRW